MSLQYELHSEVLCLQNTNDIDLLNILFGQGTMVKNFAELSNLSRDIWGSSYYLPKTMELLSLRKIN